MDIVNLLVHLTAAVLVILAIMTTKPAASRRSLTMREIYAFAGISLILGWATAVGLAHNTKRLWTLTHELWVYLT